MAHIKQLRLDLLGPFTFGSIAEKIVIKIFAFSLSSQPFLWISQQHSQGLHTFFTAGPLDKYLQQNMALSILCDILASMIQNFPGECTQFHHRFTCWGSTPPPKRFVRACDFLFIRLRHCKFVHTLIEQIYDFQRLLYSETPVLFCVHRYQLCSSYSYPCG